MGGRQEPMRASGNTITYPVTAILAAFLAGLSAFAASAQAQPPKEIAEQIPLSVNEVIVGGEWGSPESDGAYRAVLISRNDDGTPAADVVLQWVAFGEENGRVVHSETVGSLTGEPAVTAFIAFDFGENDEVTRLLIGSYDPETNEDDLRFVRLGAPGEFAFVSPPEVDNDTAE